MFIWEKYKNGYLLEAEKTVCTKVKVQKSLVPSKNNKKIWPHWSLELSG